VVGQNPLQEPGPRCGHVQRLGEQIGEIVDLDAEFGQDPGEDVVLRSGGTGSVVARRCGDPVRSGLGPVHDDLAQPADFGTHMKGHVRKVSFMADRCLIRTG